MKHACLAIYLLTGIGTAIGMPPHENHPSAAFLVRMAAWPVVAGNAIAEHRQFVRTGNRILRAVAYRLK